MPGHRAEVDDHTLERRHDGAAHDGHHEEGRAQGGVLRSHVFQGYSVDGGEHEAHEEADAHKAVKSNLAHYAYGAKGAEGRADAEEAQHLAGVEILHEHGGDEAAAEEEHHCHDVVGLSRGLVDAEVVGVLDDEGPHHNLRGHIEELGEHAFAVDTVVPEVAQSLPGRMSDASRLLLFTAGLGHAGKGDDDEHRHYHEAYDHVGVADHREVMHTDVGLLGLGEKGEDDASGGIAPVGPELGKDDERGDCHAAQRPHGVEGLGQVQPAGRCLPAAERKDVGVGSGLQESEPEGKDIEADAEEGEALARCRRDEEEGAHGVEPESKEDSALIGVAADEEGCRNGHREIAAIEGELDERSLGGGDFHHGLESRHHGVGDVVGEAPEREEARDEDKGDEIFPLDKRGGGGGRFHYNSKVIFFPGILQGELEGRGRIENFVRKIGVGNNFSFLELLCGLRHRRDLCSHADHGQVGADRGRSGS